MYSHRGFLFEPPHIDKSARVLANFRYRRMRTYACVNIEARVRFEKKCACRRQTLLCVHIYIYLGRKNRAESIWTRARLLFSPRLFLFVVVGEESWIRAKGKQLTGDFLSRPSQSSCFFGFTKEPGGSRPLVRSLTLCLPTCSYAWCEIKRAACIFSSELTEIPLLFRKLNLLRTIGSVCPEIQTVIQGL